jgi:hypothetical protein
MNEPDVPSRRESGVDGTIDVQAITIDGFLLRRRGRVGEDASPWMSFSGDQER